MPKPLFDLSLDTAFEEVVGHSGANRQAFQQYVDKLLPRVADIRKNPQREAQPVLSLPSQTDDLADIESTAKAITDHFSTLVVVGMGGSSLSAETLAAIHNPSKVTLHLLDNIDPHSMGVLLESLDWKRTAFLIISKSGNTLETLAQAAILLRGAKATGCDITKQFYAITMTDCNPLHTVAKTHGFKVLPHDPRLGGRFSILSSVGLLPAAAIGMDIRKLRSGAQSVLSANFSGDMDRAGAIATAALHLTLIDKDIRSNVIMYYGDRLSGLASWHRQCWAESLGKCPQATTPIRSRGATDQHSQLQLYLDGPKDKLFSLLLLNTKGRGQPVGFDGNTDARLDFLKNHTLGDLMAAEQHGTMATLVKRGCPVRSFIMDEINEEVLGALLMHFSLEVMFTAELLSVNAFDQPAVEDGKVLAMQYLSGKKA